MKPRAKAVLCYVAALFYTFFGVFLLKGVFGDSLRDLPRWESAALYVAFILPNLALVAYGYIQWMRGAARKPVAGEPEA